VTVFPGLGTASRPYGAEAGFAEAHIHVRYTPWKSGTPELATCPTALSMKVFVGFVELEHQLVVWNEIMLRPVPV
jgi:hypothetical protein